jgi:hypothetical protein
MRPGIAFELLLPVREFAEELGVQWWIAGGWATDLFLGRVTREHRDVDLLVLDRDQDRLRELWRQGSLLRRHKGEFVEWPEGDRLVPGADLLQPPSGVVGGCKVELMVGMTRGDSWVFHRGNLSIERPISELGFVGPLGLPYLAPEVSLRTRARFSRETDEADFRHVVPALSPKQREWLRQRLPAEHPWCRQLEVAG